LYRFEFFGRFMESPLSFFACMGTLNLRRRRSVAVLGHSNSRRFRVPVIGRYPCGLRWLLCPGTGTLRQRFMGSPHPLLRAPWDHEPITDTLFRTEHFIRNESRGSSGGSGFMESPQSPNMVVHWNHERKICKLLEINETIPRFMESPDPQRIGAPWDHELSRRAGILPASGQAVGRVPARGDRIMSLGSGYGPRFWIEFYSAISDKISLA